MDIFNMADISLNSGSLQEPRNCMKRHSKVETTAPSRRKLVNAEDKSSGFLDDTASSTTNTSIPRSRASSAV